MDEYAAGRTRPSLEAATTHCVKLVLLGQSAVEQMRKRQPALQAEQRTDEGPNAQTMGPRASPHFEHFKSMKQMREA